MAHSGRKRHRDGEPTPRQFDNVDPPAVDRVFRITDAERERIAECLRFIDEARRALESQHNGANRDIVRELRASADRIYDLINGLEETAAEDNDF